MADPTKDPFLNKFAEMQPQMPNVDPNVLSKVPGIQNVQLANAPTFSPEGVATYPEPAPTRDQMGVFDRISDAFKSSRMGQWADEAFGQEAFNVGNGEFEVRNKFAGIVGDPIPYSEASTEGKQSALSGMISGGLTERTTPTPQAPTPQMATPESVANLSISGTPLTQDAITSASVQSPEAPSAGSVQPQVPSIDSGSGITKDGVFYPTQQPMGDLKAYEDRLKQTIAAGEMTPQMIAQAASEASPSASPQQVAIAQQEAATRQANIEADQAAKEYGDTLSLGGGTIAEREAKIQKFRDEFVEKQKPAEVKTPEQIRSERVQAQEDEKRLQLLDQKIEAGKTPDATPEAKKAAARAQGVKDGTITQAQADEATKQDLIGKPPTGYATWAEYESNTGIDADGDGKVSTPAEAEDAATPEPTDHKSANDAAKAAGETTYTFQGKKYKVQ